MKKPNSRQWWVLGAALLIMLMSAPLFAETGDCQSMERGEQPVVFPMPLVCDPVFDADCPPGQSQPPQSVVYLIQFNEPPAAAQFTGYPISQEQYAAAAVYANNLKVQHQQYLSQINGAVSGFSQKEIRHFTITLNGIMTELSASERDQIAALPFVSAVSEMPVVEPLLRDSVPLIGADQVWNLEYPPAGYTGAGVKVGIIDTGIDYNHVDLAFNIWTNPNEIPNNGIDDDNDGMIDNIHGFDFFDSVDANGDGDYTDPEDTNDPDPMDESENGHGTHVSGIVAANNHIPGGIRGVAPDATLYGYRVCGYMEQYGGTRCPSDDIATALERTVDPNGDGNAIDHLDVVNVSIGSQNNDPNNPAAQQVNNAVAAGVVAVAAAGNDREYLTIGNYGCARKAITVGASDDEDALVYFSSLGPLNDGSSKPDILAPGWEICSSGSAGGGLCEDQSHHELSGTSMATPHVTGTVALLLQEHPDWNPDQIKYAIRNSAVDVGYNVLKQGHGRVSAIGASQEEPPCIVTLEKVSDTSEQVQFQGGLVFYGSGGAPMVIHYRYDIGHMGIEPSFERDTINDPAEWLAEFHQEGDITLQPNVPSEPIVFSAIDKLTQFPDGIYLVQLQATYGSGEMSIDYHSFTVNNVYGTTVYDGDVYGRNFDIDGTVSVLPDGYRYTVEYAGRANPDTWSSAGMTLINGGEDPVIDGRLASFNAPDGFAPDFYDLRLSIYHGDDLFYTEPLVLIRIDPDLRSGFPVFLPSVGLASHSAAIPAIKDIDADGAKEISFVRRSGTQTSLYTVRNDGTVEDPLVTNDGYRSFNRFSLLADDFDGLGADDFLYEKFDILSGTPNRIIVHDQQGETIRITDLGDQRAGLSYNSFFIDADLNHDGVPEVIFAAWSRSGSWWAKRLYVTDFAGNPLPGWAEPQSFASCTSATIDTSPVIGNFDNDPDDEIAFVSDSRAFCEAPPPQQRASEISICNVEGGCTLQPVLVNGLTRSSPVSADLDSDGIDEIVITTRQGVHVYHPDSGVLQDWLEDFDFQYESPVVADMDSDGFLDILAMSGWDTYPGNLYVLRSNGTIISQWDNLEPEMLGPIVGDIDGNGQLDSIYGWYDSINRRTDFARIYWVSFLTIHAKDRQGNELPGFPKYGELPPARVWTFNGKDLVDLDNDGLMELIITSAGGRNRPTDANREILYAFDLNVPDSPLQHIWPTMRGGYERQGRYEGLNAPVRFGAVRQGWDIALSWQHPRLSGNLSGYVVQSATWSDFRDAHSVDLSLQQDHYNFNVSFHPGLYYLRVGSFDNGSPRRVMWSPTKRVCIPGRGGNGPIACLYSYDTPLSMRLEPSEVRAIDAGVSVDNVATYYPNREEDIFSDEGP